MGERLGLARGAASLAAAWLALPGWAAVLESDAGGFVSAHEVEIAAPRARVFEALVAEVGVWWDPAHTYTGDASNMTFSEFPALWERFSDEGFVRHMAIDMVRPPATLRLSGGLGPLQPLAVTGSMTFELEDAGKGTKLAYRYLVNGRGLQDRAGPVDRVMVGQLERLRRYVETGTPVVKPSPAENE